MHNIGSLYDVTTSNRIAEVERYVLISHPFLHGPVHLVSHSEHRFITRLFFSNIVPWDDYPRVVGGIGDDTNEEEIITSAHLPPFFDVMLASAK